MLRELEPLTGEGRSFRKRALVGSEGACYHLFIDCERVATIDLGLRYVTLFHGWDATMKSTMMVTSFLKQWWAPGAFFADGFVLGVTRHYKNWTLVYMTEA